MSRRKRSTFRRRSAPSTVYRSPRPISREIEAVNSLLAGMWQRVMDRGRR